MRNSLFDLGGRIALVTGASRGIGAACASLLAANGAHVIITSRKATNLVATRDRILASGGMVTAVECHAGDLAAIDDMLLQAAEAPGVPDIVICNAATNPHFGPIAEIEISAIDKVIEVNLRGSFYLARQAANLMKAAGGGSIVLMSSVNAVRPGHWQGIYSVSKAAMISMAKAMAKEYGADGIRVNALLPGLTDTHFASALTRDDKLLGGFLRQVPMRRIAQPDEIAAAALFLVSPAASYVTGVGLPVDGGFLA